MMVLDDLNQTVSSLDGRAQASRVSVEEGRSRSRSTVVAAITVVERVGWRS